jgi:hypothetical protein
MRKITNFLEGVGIFLLLSLFAFQAHAIFTDAGTSNVVDKTETVRRKDPIDINVFNSSVETMPSGSIVIYDTASDNGVAVTAHATNGIEGIPAACVTVNLIEARKQGKCRIYGYHPGVRYSPYLGGTTATAGFPMYVGPVPTRVTSYDSPKGATGAPGTSMPNNFLPAKVGTFLDTVTGTSNVEAFIQIN